MVLGPSTILKSAGTVNKEPSGSDRVIFVSWKVCSPIRGSLLLLYTIVLRSGEAHTSVTMLMGFSLPIWPAGIVRVVRFPVTKTPSIVCEPRSSVVTWPLSAVWNTCRPAIMGSGGGKGPGAPASAPTCIKKVSEPATLGAPGGGGGIGGILCAVLSVRFKV